jgi:hypothetical protein
MIQHNKVIELVARLRATGNEDDARIVETLHVGYRNAVNVMLAKGEAADFYARQADLKMNWGK